MAQSKKADKGGKHQGGRVKIRELQLPLFEAFLSINAANKEQRDEFLFGLCLWAPARRTLTPQFSCGDDCGLCCPGVFAVEQATLRPLAKAFKDKRFTLRDIEVLNKRLDGLVSPAFHWEHRNEDLAEKERQTGWRTYAKDPGLINQDDLILLRGIRIKNPLGRVCYDLFSAILTPIITLDIRSLPAEEWRKLQRYATAYRRKVDREQGLGLAGPGRPKGTGKIFVRDMTVHQTKEYLSLYPEEADKIEEEYLTKRVDEYKSKATEKEQLLFSNLQYERAIHKSAFYNLIRKPLGLYKRK